MTDAEIIDIGELKSGETITLNTEPISSEPSAPTRVTTPGTATGARPPTRTPTTSIRPMTCTSSTLTASAATADRAACSLHRANLFAPTAPIAQTAARGS